MKDAKIIQGAVIMHGIINAYIQNDGAGKWLTLPVNRDNFQKAISEVGAADRGSITVGEYTSNAVALPTDLLANAELDRVNYLAARLAGMDETQLAMLDAIMESPFRFTTVEQLIDYADNEDYFLFRPGINDAAELGWYYVYDTGLCQMPNEWKGGIDLKKFGAHAAQQERGVFTSVGYLMLSGDEWHNRLAEQGIPNEYRLLLE